MAKVVKTVVRTAVILGVVGAAAVVVAGPVRLRALTHQARDNIRAAIDRHIDDPVALREQFRALEAQYPQRIASVKGDLAELDAQIAQLGRELAVSKGVVALADRDLTQMHDVIARAQEAKAQSSYAVVRVVLDNGARVTLDQAYTKANKVQNVREAHATRSKDLERDLGYLSQQRVRLAELLEQYQAEQADFQAKIWQLDRRVDAFARNERLLKMLEERQARIDQLSRYEVASLSQLEAQLDRKLADQESRFAALGRDSEEERYEKAARYLLDAQERQQDAWSPTGGFKGEVEVRPEVIEVGPRSEGLVSRER